MSKELSSQKVKEGQIKIRFAEEDDLKFVQQDRYISEDIILRKIRNKEVIVVEKEEKPVGYLRIEYLWSKLPYLALIYVNKPFRQQGIGKSMLNFLTSWLNEQGYNVLYSSSQANEPSPQNWHRHMGFEECGTLEGINEDGSGEIFFRKMF